MDLPILVRMMKSTIKKTTNSLCLATALHQYTVAQVNEYVKSALELFFFPSATLQTKMIFPIAAHS